MDEKFDYKQSLTNIKASLFDIYEDQEKVIGSLEDDKKTQHLQDFIEVKDLALFLLNRIQELYSLPEDDNDDSFSIDIETQKDSDLEDNNSLDSSVTVVDDNTNNNDVEAGEEKDDQEVTVDFDNDDSSLEEANEADSNDTIEEFSNSIEDDKYYLTCEEKDLHFAYVSQKLYDKLKSHSDSSEVTITSDEVEESNDSDNLEVEDDLLYKKDELKPKGIIVRNDQYMKLALSKHRQEGVLEEAKDYRREVIKKKRKEEQERALEEAKVEINI